MRQIIHGCGGVQKHNVAVIDLAQCLPCDRLFGGHVDIHALPVMGRHDILARRLKRLCGGKRSDSAVNLADSAVPDKRRDITVNCSLRDMKLLHKLRKRTELMFFDILHDFKRAQTFHASPFHL